MITTITVTVNGAMETPNFLADTVYQKMEEFMGNVGIVIIFHNVSDATV